MSAPLSPATPVTLPAWKPPLGVTLDDIELADGTTLRTARWVRRGPCVGTVLICSGRGEYVEKYFEAASDLLARGFAVVVFDWRGQGLSSRALRNGRKGHVDDFAAFGRDLDAVLDRIVEPSCPRPFYALAHSMGGAVVLHHARFQPCRFERIVLSAPMISVARLPTSPRLLRKLAGWATRLGFGEAFVPQRGRTAVIEHGFDGNVLTTDPDRFAVMAALSRAEPRLTIDAPTIGWLKAALDAMQAFGEAGFAEGITVPTLVVVPGDDRVVEIGAMQRFGRRLRAGVVVTLPGARHEILMERDALRDQFWAAFDAFVPGTRINAPSDAGEPAGLGIRNAGR